jgi:nitrogen-specific signal transduction histidine kinase/FixJ family two-component response regulator
MNEAADATEANQLQGTRRKLEQAALVTSRLSHDFGNVLTGIMGFAELSLAQLDKDSPAGRYLAEVLEATQRGAAWIHKLHVFCRRNVSEHWPTPLPVVIAEQQARLKDASGVALRVELNESLPLLAVDADSARHVLTQLVDNAREAVNGKGTITIAARLRQLQGDECASLLGSPAPGPHVEICVRDNGPGISAAVRARLFNEPFYSTKPRYRGLGLMMVYGILQRFGGGLSLDSSDDGTTVRVYLPAAAPPAVPAVLDAARVLVVTDDPILRESCAAILSAAGAQVTPAAGAHQALALYQTVREPFAVVLADLRLAELSGCDLARRMLDRAADAEFVFIQTQTQTSPGRDERLKSFEVLYRPFDATRLVRAVHAALERQQPGATQAVPQASADTQPRLP